MTNDQVLALTGFFSLVIGWKLSGQDSSLEGTSAIAGYAKRILRTYASYKLLLFGVKSLLANNGLAAAQGDKAAYAFSGMSALTAFLVVGIIWVGPIVHMASSWLNGILDPADNRPWDPKATEKNLDRLSKLAHAGRTDAAIRLAKRLKKEGDVSGLMLDTMIARLTPEKVSLNTNTGLRIKL